LKIGVTGDTHNNLKNIENICNIFNSLDVHLVVHTGDITLPKSLEIFRNLNCPLVGVFGNNDEGDKESLTEMSNRYGFDIEDGPKILELADKKIFIVHDPLEIEENFFNEADIILHGHTHRYRDEVIRKTHIFNPGECAGILKGKNNIGVINLQDIQMQIINF
tara:strand:+ start:299 stop:787 length:489 start_codon:yes stop_codon:yes gene_type:complete